MEETEPAPLEGSSAETLAINRLRRHLDRLTARFDLHLQNSDEAYPGKDRRKHHDYHLSIEQRDKMLKEFWEKLLGQVVGGFIIAALTLISSALFFYFKYGMKL